MPLDKEAFDQILKDISLSGAASEENRSTQLILGSRSNLSHILSVSSGLPRMKPNIRDKFKLLLSQPMMLSALNPFEIRCCLCNTVISYPAWYYTVKYAVNHFHYFICFDSNSTNEPTARCYRK